jgi:hypothetical protein
MLPVSYINYSASNKLRQFYFLAERKLAKLCKEIKLALCVTIRYSFKYARKFIPTLGFMP